MKIITWSTKYDKNTAAETKFVNGVKRNRVGLLKEISGKLIA